MYFAAYIFSLCSILKALNDFADRIPLNNAVESATFALKNFGIVALDIGSPYGTDVGPQQTFSADLGPVESAVADNRTILQEQLTVSSEAVSSDTTGSLSLQSLGTCKQQNGETNRVVYSVFRTNALFLTPETACQQFAIGSIILGVRKSNCPTLPVTVDLQSLNEVSIITLKTKGDGNLFVCCRFADIIWLVKSSLMMNLNFRNPHAPTMVRFRA